MENKKDNGLEDISVKETLKTEENPSSEKAETSKPSAPEAPKEEAPKTKSKEEELSQELSDTKEKMMRVLAEYDNFRKRSQKEKDGIYDRAVAETVSKFIPIVDNMERAVQQECSDQEYAKGISLINDMLSKVLDGLKVEEFGKIGDEFNAEMHSAVMHIDDENLGENVIANVMQKGYKIGDKVIRFAVVTVAN